MYNFGLYSAERLSGTELGSVGPLDARCLHWPEDGWSVDWRLESGGVWHHMC